MHVYIVLNRIETILRTRRVPAAGRHAPGFLELFLNVSVRTSVCICVWVFVCPPLGLLITCGMKWTPYDWLNKFYSCYMATVLVIINGHGIRIGMHCKH